MDGLLKISYRSFIVALGEEHVSNQEGEILAQWLAFVGALKLFITLQGGVHRVLHDITHRRIVERTHLLVIGGQKRTDMGDDHARLVVFAGVEKNLSELEEGLRGLVGLGTDLGELLEFAFVFLIELVFEGKILGPECGDFLRAIGFHFFLLHGDDVLLGQHRHVSGGGLVVEALAIGLGAESGPHEKDFTELEISVVDKGEIFFACDDSAQQFFGLFQEVEPLVFVSTVLGQHFAPLCSQRDGEQILAAINSGSGWEFLDVVTEIRCGLLKVGDLVFAECAAVDHGFEVGGLWILRDKIGIAFDRLLEDALAACIRHGQRHGFCGQDLRVQVIYQRSLVWSEGRTGLGFLQAGERLVELTQVELADTELNGGRLDENVGGVSCDDALIGCGCAFVVGA